MEQHPLVGMWQLVEYHVVGANLDIETPASRTGFLLYGADGSMAEAIQARPEDDKLPVTSLFYCGRYEVAGDTVTHIPAVHTNADLVGRRLDRRFHMEEGNRFMLVAARPEGAAHLHWERVTP